MIDLLIFLKLSIRTIYFNNQQQNYIINQIYLRPLLQQSKHLKLITLLIFNYNLITELFYKSMSRLLKQVYSENVYVQFRFESSLRKYDKKPTKKIKCEAFCKHCINHHKKIEYSPLKQTRPNIQFRSKFKKSNIGSIQKRSEKQIISQCKTMKLSKQKQEIKNDKNLLQMKLYRGLLQDKQKGNDKIQKSQQENSSSMEEEIFFNQFGHSPEQSSNKDVMDKDFDLIQIPNRIPSQDENNIVGIDQIKAIDQIKESKQEQLKGQTIEEEKIQIQTQQKQSLVIVPQSKDQSFNLHPIELIYEQSIEKHQQNLISQITIHQQIQIKPLQVIQNNIHQNIQDNTIENQSPPLLTHTIFEDNSCIDEQRLRQECVNENEKQIIEQKFMADSMMDKCLLFEGGRIYVDTSGLNFYISVRVFNKLRRKYSNTQELTKILIEQRPCLLQKKDKIRNQLEEYLRSLA